MRYKPDNAKNERFVYGALGILVFLLVLLIELS